VTESYSNETYKKYRGKCKEYCEQLIKEDPTLRMVRGYYWCPIWNTDEGHWWCVKPDGEIVDPTKLQFPSAGHGQYTEFDGNCECSQCGKSFKEEVGIVMGNGNYICCSNRCAMRLVGL